MVAPACRRGHRSRCDAHGNLGGSYSGAAAVLIENLPALRTLDTGMYPPSCFPAPAPVPQPVPVPGTSNKAEPREWRAIEGAGEIWIDGDRFLVAEGHETIDSHGRGRMAEGTGNVLVGGSTLDILERTRADAIDIIDDALLALDRWDEADRARFKEWFGEDSEAARSAMREKLLKVRERLQTVRFDAMDAQGLYGQVTNTDSTAVRLGGAFWGASRFGTDSKAGVLVHEGSHFRDTTGSGDHAYGADGARKLAQDNPRAAQSNADSIEYFVESSSPRR